MKDFIFNTVITYSTYIYLKVAGTLHKHTRKKMFTFFSLNVTTLFCHRGHIIIYKRFLYVGHTTHLIYLVSPTYRSPSTWSLKFYFSLCTRSRMNILFTRDGGSCKVRQDETQGVLP